MSAVRVVIVALVAAVTYLLTTSAGEVLAAGAAEAALAGVPLVDLAQMIGVEASASACAYALVKLLHLVA